MSKPNNDIAPDIRPKTANIKREQYGQLPLVRLNFIMMAIAGAMIVIGFLLMLGGSSTVDSFNPDIFSTRRIVIGPMVTFLGFIFMGVAIVIRPKPKTETRNGMA
ncbi:MAG: DUF3098 domain-containing protein [Muribaculaceae bacterium]|jgi:hypothetical protein|nr:DUF3098 domain-containing protein [Muribaculaceae bacterium]